MPDERAIVPAPSSLSPDSHRRTGTADSPWRDDAHAVVIGINEYADPKIPNLRFARADAELVYAVLTDPAVGRFKPDNVTLLLDAQATERNMRSALGTQLPRRAGSDATVFIYFAGHGAPVIDPRAKSADGLEKYLIPTDAVADDLRSSGISMDAVQQYFSWLDASQVVCFLDSCYSGTAGGRSFDHPSYQTRAMLSDDFLDSLSSEGRFVVSACSANEVSLESTERGHGIFTHYLVEGLKGAADADGNGKVTIDELYEYVYKNVERDARSMGGSMKPVKKGSVRGTIYLTEYETAAQARVREALKLAADALTRGDNRAALTLYREVLSLDSANVEAKEATARLLEIEQSKAAELKRQQKVLLGYMNNGDLTMSAYNRALSVLDADVASLSADDRQYRRFVDSLIAGELTIRSFVRSVELLDSETSEHAQADAPAPAVARPAAPIERPAPTVERMAPAISPSVPAPSQPSTKLEPPLKPRPGASPTRPAEWRNSGPTPQAPNGKRLWLKATAGVGFTAIAFAIWFIARGATPDSTQAGGPPTADTIATRATSTRRFRATEFTPVARVNVPIDAVVTIRFPELEPDDRIDVSTVTPERVQFDSPYSRVVVRVTADGNSLTLTPAEPLIEWNRQYTVGVRAGIKSIKGKTLEVGSARDYTTVWLDSLHTYRLSNEYEGPAQRSLSAGFGCGMAPTGDAANQAFFFTPVPGHEAPDAENGHYYYIHVRAGGPKLFLSGAVVRDPVPPGACGMVAEGQVPTTLYWKFVQAPFEVGSRFYLRYAAVDGRSLGTPVVNGQPIPQLQKTEDRLDMLWSITRSGRR